MYIVHLQGGLTVKADSDEIQKIIQNPTSLILLRNGAVKVDKIVGITEDKERKKEYLKKPGESVADVEARIAAAQMPDIFKGVREQLTITQPRLLP